MRIAPISKRDHVTSNLNAGEYRYDTFEERSHIIVPVVLMTEGVHSGSGGPIFYPANELSTLAESWNGVPVPVYHPDENGMPCTCNDPRVIERQNVGRMFNVHWDKNRLIGEAWIDVQKADEVFEGLVNMLKDPKTRMEVSTGLYSQHDLTPGSWNGEDYEAIVRNIRPDHLALLPGSVGACSWEDGCGVRNMDKNVEKYLQNVIGQREAHRKIFQYVDGMDNAHHIHYLEEVYENYFIYRREPISDNRSTTEFFKVSYSVSESDDLEVVENEVTKVTKKVSYEAISNNRKGDTKMANRTDETKTTENQCPECKVLVDNLISNEATKWGEDDREFLDELDLEVLQKMEPLQNEEKDTTPPEPDNTATPETNEEEEKPVTTKAYIEEAPPEIREVLNSALSTHEKKKKELVERITSNSKNRFTKEQLEAKSLDELEILSELASTVNYEGQGGSVQTQNQEHEEEPLTMPVLNYETEK